MARAVGRVSSCGWVGAARVIADSAHCCQASILAVWLGCMRKFVAAHTVKVEEQRLSGHGDDCTGAQMEMHLHLYWPALKAQPEQTIQNRVTSFTTLRPF